MGRTDGGTVQRAVASPPAPGKPTARAPKPKSQAIDFMKPVYERLGWSRWLVVVGALMIQLALGAICELLRAEPTSSCCRSRWTVSSSCLA